MGFFGRLFRRKRGGTRVGNWLRQLGHDKTGGLVGYNVDKNGTDEINDNLLAEETIDGGFTR